ncbi:hypothetical protein FGIG_12544 [Fasciola gigantica]|uniref:Uncharacterized protein n=1 Tax=Fasciola gigantica TaxID=46835 RepID=A0A504YPP5_FASGI|nr:hypothetical protein FGIG_12544 [Fasciola gigantica]
MTTVSQARPAVHSNLASLLRPQYRGLLRYSKKRPHLFRIYGSVSLITCFAVCMCAAACMHKIADEIMEESITGEDLQRGSLENTKYNGKSRLGVITLKKILEQRGVIFDHVIEREEIDLLLQQTGQLNHEELRYATKPFSASGWSLVDTSPDAKLHAQVSANNPNDHSSNGHPVPGAVSFVFDSEASFVERVDDNKDSVWLLSVIALDSQYRTKHETSDGQLNTLITDEVWGRLVRRYIPFGFKMGLINCYRLLRSVSNFSIVSHAILVMLK